MRYTDNRGWEYEVRKGLQGEYKIFYRKPKPGRGEEFGWHARRVSCWFENEEAAMADLVLTATRNGWRKTR